MTRPPRSNKSAKPAAEGVAPRSNTGGLGWPLRLALVLFALSGCSALIYEIVWFQMLELVVGSSAISLGILLASFMGGLCLGSMLLPRFIPTSANPFRVYGWIELGIGALAILVWFEVPLVRHLYTGSGMHVVFGGGGILLRALIAGLCLLPPTILMGAALPAVARRVEISPGGVSWLGLLYGSNTVGAVVGCLLAGFYLLRVHDMAIATFVAASINGVVGAVALLLARDERNLKPTSVAVQESVPRPQGVRGIYFAIAASGFCALGGEIVWTRLLALLLGGTVYTFSIILAVFLVGLGAGSAVGAVLARESEQPLHALGVCQVLLAAAVAWAAYMVGGSLPHWPIAPALALNPWIVFQLDLVRAMWALLPAALLWGASFPIALAAAASRGQDPGKLVGEVYGANTIGAIAGALIFTFLLVPGFGSHVAQEVLIAVTALSGIGLLAISAYPKRKGVGRVVVAVVLVSIAALAWRLVLSVPPVPGELIAFGRSLAYRSGVRDPRTNALVGLPNLLYVGEGTTESVAVSGDDRLRTYHVSGKIEASTSPKDMRLQSMLGNIPALVHPRPRSVLIVGFGAGVTAGTFVLYPGVERIVICEIEPLVPKKISQFFRVENNDVFSDKRVEIVYDDARHYMLTTREKFDIITSDPIHPWVKGSAVLYSRDYFELVQKHLNPGGVVTQWIPLYQSSEATVKSELATFFSVFSRGTVWANTDDRGLGYDLVLLGGNSKTVIDLADLDARLKRPDHLAVSRALQQVGFQSPMQLMSKYTTNAADLAPWLVGAEINRDRNLRLQYQAGLESYVEDEADIFGAISNYRMFPEDFFVGPFELKQELMNGGTLPTVAH